MKKLQDTSQWNGNVYYYYSGLLHNDCADFVSQALSYGGMTEDGTWYATKYSDTRSTTWVKREYLVSYMKSNGHFTSISIASAGAGTVVDMIPTNHSHIVMVTYFDGSTYRFSAHTNDRHNLTSSISSYNLYSVSY